jgi:hypothetical protein
MNVFQDRSSNCAGVTAKREESHKVSRVESARDGVRRSLRPRSLDRLLGEGNDVSSVACLTVCAHRNSSVSRAQPLEIIGLYL